MSRNDVPAAYFSTLLGLLLITGFGGFFLIRYATTGDFYVVEFSLAALGIVLIVIGQVIRSKTKSAT